MNVFPLDHMLVSLNASMRWARFLSQCFLSPFFMRKRVGILFKRCCFDVFACVWFSCASNRSHHVSPRVCICMCFVSVLIVLFVGDCLCAVVCLRVSL